MKQIKSMIIVVILCVNVLLFQVCIGSVERNLTLPKSGAQQLNDMDRLKELSQAEKVSMWVEEMSQKFLEKCEDIHEEPSKYLLRAARIMKRYRGDPDYNNVYILLLACKDIGIASQDDVDEYIKCDIGMTGDNNLHWDKVEVVIKKLKSDIKAEKVSFKTTMSEKSRNELLGSINPGYLENLRKIYEDYYLRIDLEIDIDNLIALLALANQKALDFNERHDANKKEVTEVVESLLNQETQLLPIYMKKVISIDNDFVFIYVMDKLEIISLEEERWFSKMVTDIKISSKLMREKYHHMKEKKQTIEWERKDEIRKNFFGFHMASKNIGDIRRRGFSGWHLRFFLERIEDDIVRSDESLVKLYKKCFVKLDTDLPFVMNDLDFDGYIDSILLLEEKIGDFLSKKDGKIDNEKVYQVYEDGSKHSPPCICDDICEKWVRYSLIYLLEEDVTEKERKVLINNMSTILRLEHIMQINHADYYNGVYRSRVDELLPNLAKLESEVRSVLSVGSTCDSADQDEPFPDNEL